MTRQFILQPAVKEEVPLFIGLVGPSSSGKTFSALRMANGIHKVMQSPGGIIMIDTENRRGLHYADDFTYQHIPFGAPFGSLDYLAAIRFAQEAQPSAIIIDSMSHEHEGPGGMLDFQSKEVDRMAGPDAPDWKRHSVGFTAWGKPKAARRQFLTGLMESDAAIIACFRGQEKTKPVKNDKGKMEPTNIGWQAIADPNMVFEMAVCALLMPGANGVPTWSPEKPAEKTFVKIPGWARDIFRDGEQLGEKHGEALANWAKGGASRPKIQNTDIEAIRAEGDHAASLGMERFKAFWDNLPKETQRKLVKDKDDRWKPAAMKADAKIEDEESLSFDEEFQDGIPV
ncbi:MAG: hypothetical protein AAFP81_01015 [Pseudomonadota bacterium]